MIVEIATLALSLWILMDPIGNVPIYAALLRELPSNRQRIIILRESIIAVVVMFLFFFFGDGILNALHLTTASIQLSGGIILFIIALRMIFPPPKDTNISLPDSGEPFIVPLAIPLVAGPAILAAIVIYKNSDLVNNFLLGIALAIAWLISTLILISSTLLEKVLGKRGLIACERLMGFLITLIAVQMFLEGLSTFMADCGIKTSYEGTI